MKIALVTGASSGMGRDFVKELDSYGFDEIWAIARREDELSSLSGECTTKVRGIPMDLRNTSAFDDLAELLRRDEPEIEYLICAAGYGRFGSYEEVTAEDSRGMIDLNCTALVQTTYLALPYMKKGAHIIEVVSSSAFQPLPYMNVYASTKSFVLSFTRSLRYELRDRGINVCALCPGWVRTPFISNAEKTDKAAVNSFPGMKESGYIVKKALRSSERGRAVCTPGAMTTAQRMLAKVLPVPVLTGAWNMMRK